MRIKKVQFAKDVGVTTNLVHQASRAALYNACDGPYIDDEHPVAVAWAESHRKRISAKEQIELNADAADVSDLTMSEVLALYGTTPSAAPWLTASKILEQIAEKARSNNALSDGYVSRKLVQLAVIVPAEDTLHKIQTAGAKTIVAMLETKQSAGATPKECERFISDQLSSFIKPMKAKMKSSAASVAAGKTPGKKGRPKKQVKLPGETLIDSPIDAAKCASMSTNEIVEEFIADHAFILQLRAAKTMEDINEKRIKAAISDKTLISRHAVKAGIIDPLDAALLKLLSDGAKTISIRVAAMRNAGEDITSREKYIADQVLSHKRPFMSKANRTIANG